MNRVIIYPAFDAFYYSFYIQGLIEVFGESSIQFSYQHFPSLSPDCLAFILKGKRELRVVVDAYDGANITNHAGIEWCDVYGKVNLVSPLVPKSHAHKCVAIGPSFPVQVWSRDKAWWIALRNYRLSVQGTKYALEHFANYRRQYKYRLPVKCFVPGSARDGYIFFLSSIWREEDAPGTNEHRASFMKACRSLNGVSFEGGFSPPGSPRDVARYKEYIASKRSPVLEWLEKTKCSAVVFYTPAVWLSHTFKLAEFLALGKAIISTPISRELPSPLVHGLHMHYVDGSLESIRDAINLILRDRDYRTHLERNAYNYYLSFLAPKRVIERLLAHYYKCGTDAQNQQATSVTSAGIL